MASTLFPPTYRLSTTQRPPPTPPRNETPKIPATPRGTPVLEKSCPNVPAPVPKALVFSPCSTWIRFPGISDGGSLEESMDVVNRDSSKTSSDGRGGAHSAGGKEEGQEEEVEEEDAASSSRLPKRKVSVFFGYCGIGYSGLQINPGVKTIEGDIFEAFCKAGAVSKENAVNPNKVGLTRAARTDRGVHAAGNLLSLKLILEPPLPEGYAPGSLVEYVNTLLPPFIRIWGLTRVQNGFNARTNCDSRLYEYLLPTYVFLPPKPASSMWEMIKRMRDESKAEGHGEGEGEEGSDAQQSLDSVLDHPFWNEQGSEQDFASDVKSKKKWRMPKEKLEHVRKIFSKYEGSHNFHNFTVGKEFRDRSAQRFMKKLSVSDPKIINGTEWVSIKFHGQSFMLHQIRKMIGLLVLVARTNAPPSLIPETYGPARIHVPKAPGLGLLLEEPLFGGYNQRIAENNRRIEKLGRKADEDMKRDPVEYTAYKEQMEAFKQTFIYDRIMIQEEETSEFAKWLNYLDVFQGPDFEYLNPKGVIPPQCVLKVGEKRREPGGQPKTSKASSSEQVEGKPEQEGSDSEDELDGVNQAELEG
ncbi:pseudouridine synthase [Violaceomyces palustris]|uniref:Pseudouridine synthase n=1 Tax=Violaceomyces palustris TaxID=1673888 RepID=A0ACD0NSV4_9BASI|nr:pseudouridine synthase [Violaceomyces palustris]